MNTANTFTKPQHSVNLFLPILLVGAGVVLLMANLGLLTRDPLLFLVQFWPLFLIAGGIQLLFARTGVTSTVVSALLGLAVVAGAVVYLTMPGEQAIPFWSNWNWLPRNTSLQTAELAAPLADTRAMQADLRLPSGRATLKPVTNNANLMEGRVSYLGELTQNVTRSGDTAQILIRENARNNGGFNLNELLRTWDVRLNPTVPIDLRLAVGSGSFDVDLREFAVKSIALDQGSGSTTFSLPANGQYRFNMSVGSGAVTVNLPPGLPARVIYDVASGWLNVNGLQRVSGNEQNGIYETAGFNENGSYAILDLEMGSGMATIR